MIWTLIVEVDESNANEPQGIAADLITCTSLDEVKKYVMEWTCDEECYLELLEDGHLVFEGDPSIHLYKTPITDTLLEVKDEG